MMRLKCKATIDEAVRSDWLDDRIGGEYCILK